MREATLRAVILGSVLAIVFGAANAYLGLKVGLTVSASIPAAVMSMAILRGIFRRGTVLENNMVQTIASSGEALAAGVAFTVPALILLGISPSVLFIFALSLLGGLLGILLMIPLRHYLMVKQDKVLSFPEGRACAEVLLAGDQGGSRARTVFTGLGIGVVYKFLAGGLKAWADTPGTVLPFPRNTYIGMEATPALLGVGFIIGPKISALMFAGGALGWLVLIPLFSYLGRNIGVCLFPATAPFCSLTPVEIWNSYIRYIGAGAVALGGFISLVRALPTIVASVKRSFAGFSFTPPAVERTERDIPLVWVLAGALVLIVLIGLMPFIPGGLVTALAVAVFGFFFVTVSSRLVGTVGSSANPASGMTIATLLLTALVFYALGWRGTPGMVAALSVGAIVCIAICMASDCSQDLKTGYLVGATPYRQQLGELLAVIVPALPVAFILLLLHRAYTIGSPQLAAPQANMMALVAKGIMTQSMPWELVIGGAVIAGIMELLGVSALPFAVGLYLPLSLSVPVMIGGIVRWAMREQSGSDPGILLSSGFIAGDALTSIITALLVVVGITLPNLSHRFASPLAVATFALLVIALVLLARRWRNVDGLRATRARDEAAGPRSSGRNPD